MLKKVLSVILVSVLVMGIAGCGKTQTNAKSEKEPEKGEMLSIFSYKPDTFCPIASKNEANLRMLGIIYDGLISLGDNYIPQPALAEYWQASDNNTVWTVNLRKNATWHDGGDCTADDVVYTVNQIKKLESSPYSYNVSMISEVKKQSETSVSFTLTKPLANFVNLLYFPIIKSGAEKIDTANFKPNGTGAYRFEDRNEGNIYYLVRYEKWWGGKAKTATIQVRMLPGGDTALYAFGSGTIDITPADNMDWGKFVDPTTAEYTNVPTPVYTFLGLNHKRPQLAMSEVRRAISMVIDRKEMIDEARMGYGTVANTPIRPECYLWENRKTDFKPNTAKAKKLMEESGWEFKNNVYKKVNEGVEYTASFSILINEENTVRENTARIMAKNLQEFGIKAEVVRVSYEEYAKRIADGNYDAFVGSIALSPEMDFSELLGDGNMFAYSDEEMQFVMSEMQSKQSETETKAAYSAFINLFEQTNPIVGLFFEDSVVIYSKQIQGEVSTSYYDAYRGIDSLEKVIER